MKHLAISTLSLLFLASCTSTDPVGDAVAAYSYTCDDGAEFTMTLASDDSLSMRLTPGPGATFPETTLDELAVGLYEGGGILFSGEGEEVQITYRDELRVCHPKPSTDMAPYNWGERPDDGSVLPTPTRVLTDNLLGRWQSEDDANAVREFREGNVVVDIYNGEVIDEGLWIAFVDNDAPEVPYPLDSDAGYVRITDSQGNALHFRVGTLSENALTLMYLDRGGVLTYRLAD